MLLGAVRLPSCGHRRDVAAQTAGRRAEAGNGEKFWLIMSILKTASFLPKLLIVLFLVCKDKCYIFGIVLFEEDEVRYGIILYNGGSEGREDLETSPTCLRNAK